MHNPLQDHPLLRGRVPGTTGYTQALRDLLPVITSGEDRDPMNLGRWEALRESHLKQTEPLLRSDHALALTPRALVGGFELSAYAAGLVVMIVAALILIAVLPRLPETVSLVLGVSLGLGTVVLVNHRYATLRRAALDRLGLLAPPDPPNLSGPHL